MGKKNKKRNVASLRANIRDQSNSFKSLHFGGHDSPEGEWRTQRRHSRAHADKKKITENTPLYNSFSQLDDRKRRMVSLPKSEKKSIETIDKIIISGQANAYNSGIFPLNSVEIINTANGARRRIIKHSAGIACMRKNSTNQRLEVLLVKKRYTYAFAEFMKGSCFGSNIKHGTSSEAKLIELFSEMTMPDKLIILSMDFSAMWYHMWLNNTKTRQYYYLKTRFESTFSIDDGKRLREIMALSSNGDDLWEIPKGRPNYELEGDIRCAVREFTEETGIDKSNYMLYPELSRKQSYVDKGVKYNTTYYLAFTTRYSGETNSINIINKEQISEVGEIRWMDIDMIRSVDTNHRLENLIRPMFKVMKKKIKVR